MISAHISNVISNLRLPLMIMVVFIHSYLISSEQFHIVTVVEDIFSKCIPIVAVPTFMFISGYLYFAKCKRFTISFYKTQTFRRTYTLLVPYIIWNALVIGIFWCMHRFAPTYINPEFENVANYPPPQLLNCFWAGSGGFPIAYQFWFIRDLFIIALASPLIYLIIKARYIGIVIVIMLLMCTTSSYIEMGTYFYLGAYCAINNVDFSAIKRPLLVSVICVCVVLSFLFFSSQSNEAVRKLLIISGSISLLNLKVLQIPSNHLFQQISSGAFFLFCLHGIVDLFSCKILMSVIHSENQILWIILYFVNVAMVILTCMTIYFVIKKISPKLLNYITGGR